MSKENKLNQVSFKEILKQIDINFKVEDIKKFCIDDDVVELIRKAVYKKEELQEVFLNNKESIDIKKLLLISWIRGKEKIDKIEEELSNKQLSNYSKQELRLELREVEKSMMAIKQLTKGLDIYIVTAMASNGMIEDINVLDSKEIIHKKSLRNKEKENKKIFKELNQMNSDEDEINRGMSYLIQCLEVEDLVAVLPEDIVGAITYKVEHNAYKNIKMKLKK